MILRKILTLITLFVMVVSIAACGVSPAQRAIDNTTSAPTESSNDQAAEEDDDESPSDAIVEEEEPAEPSQDEYSFEVTYVNAETWKNSIGTVWVQVIFEVTNTGAKSLYLSSGAADLEDDSGALIKSMSLISVYPDVIEPGEKAYYYEETTLEVDNPIDITVLPRPNVREAKVDTIRFPVTDITISDAQLGGIKVLGRVENTSEEDQSMVYVAIILLDDDNNPLGVVFTIIMEGIASGEKIGFETSSFSLPDNIESDTVADYIIYAYPRQMQF